MDTRRLGDIAALSTEQADVRFELRTDALGKNQELFLERSAVLCQLKQKLQENADYIAQLLAEDGGFCVKNTLERELPTALHLIDTCSREFYAAQFASMHIDSRVPLGTVATLIPFNGPLIGIGMSVAPAFFMGNQVLLKLPSKMPMFSKFLSDLLIEISDQITSVNISGREFLERCFRDPKIDAIHIYGHDEWIDRYEDAARRTGKKVLFEGPGKDPFVVFQNAVLDDAVEGALKVGCLNSGQSCSAAERFYIHESIYEDFAEKLSEAAGKLRVGSPLDSDSVIGPLASKEVSNRIRDQISDAVALGAQVRVGGSVYSLSYSSANGKECMREVCEPTVLTDCSHGMKITHEETFGPVFPLISFRAEDEALKLVADCSYGLNASVYGASENFLQEISRFHAHVVEDGTVASPEYRLLKMCGGGYKRSAWIWESRGAEFLKREGLHLLVAEFSRQAISVDEG